MMPIPALLSVSLSLSESVILLLLLLLVAVLFSIWTYRSTVPEISKRRRALLVVLRSLALAVLLFILFEPVLNLRGSETLPPRIAVLIDDSRSMTVEDDGRSRADALRDFVQSPVYRGIADGGEKAEYLFAGKLYPMQRITADSLRFDGAETDIAGALQRVFRDNERRNLAAVVLVTDGVHTTGRNPLYVAESMGRPVHVVAVGDSAEKKDLILGRVLTNTIAYVESTIPIDVTVRSAGFDGGATRVAMIEGGRTLASEQVALRPGVNEYPVSFSYTPAKEGVSKLTFSIDPLPGELTTKNNSATVYIKVLKTRMQVVALAAAPSPDVSLVQRELSKDHNVELTMFVQRTPGVWYERRPTQQDLDAADCLILIGLPTGVDDASVLRMAADAAMKRDIPLMHIPARTTDFAVLRQTLDALLPYDIVQVRKEEAEVFFEKGSGAANNPIMTTGIPTEAWKRLPPLFKTETAFKPRGGAEVLGTLSLNNISFNEPLLLQRRLSRGKIIAWTAYGLWRWQLAHDVLDGRIPELLFSNSIRWLTTRDDDKRVRIRPAKEFFDSGEDVEFLAQVYNESYEPLDNASVMVTVRMDAEERELALTPLGSGRYAGMMDLGREGDYEYAGVARFGGEEVGRDNGRFSIGELNIEFQDTRMNNVLLRQIAAAGGGSYHHIENVSGLSEALRSHELFAPVQQAVLRDIQLWNLVWLLSVAVLLFALEWYIRKQSGMI
jgi:hypothetical protein